MRRNFEHKDTNHDGFISNEEDAAVMPRPPDGKVSVGYGLSNEAVKRLRPEQLMALWWTCPKFAARMNSEGANQ